MTWIVLSIMLVVCATLQVMLPGYDVLGQAKFPVLLALALYYALNREFLVAMIAALCAGLLHDLLGQIPLGYSVMCFCCAAMVVSMFHNVVMSESALTAIFFGAVAGVAVTAGLYGLLCAGGYTGCPPLRALAKILGSGLLGAICCPFVFLAAAGLNRMAGNDGMKEDANGVG